ncbi:MAG: hypothetical protein U9N01_06210 [Euryarchaeota archaeon]|nr:hypothetical protein [Euryarchaeota archaeon]
MVVLKDVSYSKAKGMVENYLKGHENAYISMPIYRNKEDAREGEVISCQARKYENFDKEIATCFLYSHAK